MAPIHGHCDENFGEVKTLLEQFIDSGEELGASLAVNLDGNQVVDLWAGYKTKDKKAAWDRNTIVGVASTTKTITAFAALLLIDRGVLDVNAKVSRYWPEFAQNGKEDIEVRHILSHSAGLPGWERPITIQQICNPQMSTPWLAEQTPWWTPGIASGYHGLTFGHMIGELVVRTTGKSLKQFISEEIAAPLQADFQLGVCEDDCSRVSDVLLPCQSAPPRMDEKSIAYRVFSNPVVDANWTNSDMWRQGEIGSGNGHSNALGLCRILSVVSLNGESERGKFLTPETIQLIFHQQTAGTDLVTGQFLRFGIGFAITGEPSHPDWLPPGKVCFWGGHGGSIAIMDVDRRLTITYVMNKLENVGLGSSRTIQYVAAVYRALERIKRS